MSSHSSNDRLFFSSSPARAESGPGEEVDSILTRIQGIDRLDLVFDAIVSSNPDAFFDGFSRRVELIKSRNQAFEVCHITVFDKVLLLLTNNGNDLNTIPAIAYFCEEFLGIPAGTPESRKDEIVSHTLDVAATLSQALTPPPSQRGSVSTETDASTSPLKALPPDDNSEELDHLAARTGNLISIRIWKVYQNAKQEFRAVSDPTSLEKQEAAKFLRDTCENTLQHLANVKADDRLKEELEQTFSIAKHTAETLSGGRKRKFDEPLRSRGMAKETHGHSAAFGRSSRRDDQRFDDRQTLGENRQIDLFDGHSRAFTHRPRYRRGSESKYGRQLASPEPSPQRDREWKRSKKQPGRGHSGIPFGYSRQVDSYQPRSY